MSADTPSLDDLLSIFSTAEHMRATFEGDFTSGFPSGETASTITLSFTFRRTRLDYSAAPFAFEYPSKLFPEIVKQLELLKELLGLSSMMEEAYRFGDSKKSIEDAISFMEQELNQDVRGLGSLYTKMRREHFEATVKYLRELARRRQEAEARLAGARKRQAEEASRQSADNERKRREQTEKAKAEAHRRWEAEEAERIKRRKSQTSDSGYARGSAEGRAWQAFREAGGFEDLKGTFHYDDIRKAYEEEIRRRQAKEEDYQYGFYSDPFGTHRNQRASPPPGARKKWFEILGCAAGASGDEIRKAARQVAKGLHPDKNKDPEAAKKFKEISEAKAEGLQGL